MLELDYTNVLEQTVNNHGIPKIAFNKAAENAKSGCPVSKVLKAQITMDARLEG